MEKRTIQKIKDFADFIVKHPDSDFVPKAVRRLSSAKRSHELRQILIKLNADNNHRNPLSLPLMTVEDYVDYLFPENGNWSEVRDVLLIAIYQRLHEMNVTIDAELPEEENELITENE